MVTRAIDWSLRRFIGRSALILIFAATAASCATAQPSQPPSADASSAAPQVQYCTIISLSVPTKYVCNGKVYTSNELRQLRQGGEPAAK
jgi:hypothetical protein